MRYQDVLIHTHALSDRERGLLEASPPPRARIDLSDQIWIGPLSDQIAQSVIEECDKRWFGPIPHARLSRQLYSYVRELSLPNENWLWDHDHILEAAVAHSRLIHPTSAGLLCAARIALSMSGDIERIYPAVRSGISLEVFLSPTRQRNWLTDADAEVLRELVPRYPLPLPPRVHNALWHHEYAARTYYINHRWLFVCTGLEALVHTERHGSTKQFSKRVPALAAELGISISAGDAEEAYDVRCRLAHGLSLLEKEPGGPSPSQVQLYERIEDILRLAVLRSMRDSRFADIFHDDKSIRTRWEA